MGCRQRCTQRWINKPLHDLFWQGNGATSLRSYLVRFYYGKRGGRGNLWPLLTAATRYPRLTFFLVLFFFFFFLLSSLFQQALVLAVLRNLGKRTGKMGGGRREERSLASLIYRVLQDLWLNIIFLGSKKGEGRKNWGDIRIFLVEETRGLIKGGIFHENFV